MAFGLQLVLRSGCYKNIVCIPRPVPYNFFPAYEPCFIGIVKCIWLIPYISYKCCSSRKTVARPRRNLTILSRKSSTHPWWILLTKHDRNSAPPSTLPYLLPAVPRSIPKVPTNNVRNADRRPKRRNIARSAPSVMTLSVLTVFTRTIGIRQRAMSLVDAESRVHPTNCPVPEDGILSDRRKIKQDWREFECGVCSRIGWHNIPISLPGLGSEVPQEKLALQSRSMLVTSSNRVPTASIADSMTVQLR